MPLETAFIAAEERLDLTVYGRLDLSLTQGITDLLRETPQGLRTCVIDLTGVEQIFSSGLALLWLLDERFSRRGVKILVLSDDGPLLQQLPIAMHHASLKRAHDSLGLVT
jgi:anti-anti-sigma regulatory factor